MSKRFTFITLALSTMVAFLVGIILAGGVTRTPVVSTEPVPTPPSDKKRAAGVSAAPAVVNFADVAERINSAVVNIDAASKVPASRESSRMVRPDDPLDGPRDPETPRQGSGSGFIIDREGYLLTNNHVVEGAERITVTLADGRVFRGEVVGADPAIDVALVRIPGAANLPEAPLGNSDKLRAGEWVCAIGNPLGYVHSVTVGVVSFIGRKLFDQSLDDYIQTDAGINLGNSGGPLINSRGEVVGINSALSPRANNIGFAVPINQAVAILPQLKARGRVSRGFIGVTLTDVTPGLQRALGLSVSDGAMVQDVTPRSPAERAGLRPYDVIVQVEGRPVLTNQELIRDIAARQPGTVARLDIVRDGRRQMLNVKLAERPARGEEFDSTTGLERPARPGPRQGEQQPPLGVTVREMDRAFVGRQEIPDNVQGVIVSRVETTGAAHQLLSRGFVIMEINRKPTHTVADYERIVRSARPGDVLAVYYYHPALAQRSLVAVVVE
jgi:serine protease Do